MEETDKWSCFRRQYGAVVELGDSRRDGWCETSAPLFFELQFSSLKSDHFAKTGSGQTQKRKLQK
jgi:hypothetical protein